VADVRAVSNYLACNLATRSEMVVLIRHPQDGKILGQIDIDGTKLNQFDAAEEELINAVAQILAPYLMKYIETLDQ
jgi:putative methionine-R-sulfoxide reductase with GAF domain